MPARFELEMEMDAPLRKQRRYSTPKRHGYAALPGTGPEGERCNTCQHYALVRCAKTYRKCGLMKAVWTGGYGTDILARSPACRRWEAPKP